MRCTENCRRFFWSLWKKVRCKCQGKFADWISLRSARWRRSRSAGIRLRTRLSGAGSEPSRFTRGWCSFRSHKHKHKPFGRLRSSSWRKSWLERRRSSKSRKGPPHTSPGCKVVYASSSSILPVWLGMRAIKRWLAIRKSQAFTVEDPAWWRATRWTISSPSMPQITPGLRRLPSTSTPKVRVPLSGYRVLLKTFRLLGLQVSPGNGAGIAHGGLAKHAPARPADPFLSRPTIHKP